MVISPSVSACEACISRSRAPPLVVLLACAPLSLSPLAGRAREVVGGLGARHARLVLLGELGVAPPQRLRLAEPGVSVSVSVSVRVRVRVRVRVNRVPRGERPPVPGGGDLGCHGTRYVPYDRGWYAYPVRTVRGALGASHPAPPVRTQRARLVRVARTYPTEAPGRTRQLSAELVLGRGVLLAQVRPLDLVRVRVRVRVRVSHLTCARWALRRYVGKPVSRGKSVRR